MNQTIRHRRLYAFYQSKVLNSLMIVVFISLIMAAYMNAITLPAVCAALAFILAVGYALWIWIKKPARIVINNLLSTASSIFTFYFIILGFILPDNAWWYCLPAIAAVALMFICMVKPSDEVFDI